jgi:Coenzyme PQQ synthesis protein D (PqqD)
MSVVFTRRVVIPPGVLIQELSGEAVLLNLETERYFGLDEMGTCIWKALTGSASIQEAYELLLSEYEVDSEQLRNDLQDLIERLVENGLLEVSPG